MTDSAPSRSGTDLDSIVAAEMERWAVPGVALAIVDRDRTETHGFGVANVETGLPVTPDTLFRIGSITKTFTATLIVTLAAEGLVDLDAPVTRFLPELPLADDAARDALTLRHLLTHTGGFEGDYFADTGQGDDALARYVGSFGSLGQLTVPGELWSYSNSGIALAGHVAATVLDRPYEQALRERVLEPLGMERTVLSADEAIVYPVAVGHNPGKSGPEVIRRYAMPRSIVPAGGIISTANDLTRYARFHLDGGPNAVAAERVAIEAMQQPLVPASNFCDAVGLAWMIRSVGGRTLIEHGGDWMGLQAQLTLVPEERLAIAVLTNGSQGSALNREVVAFLLRERRGLQEQPPERIDLPVAALAAYAGTYDAPLGRGTQGTVAAAGSGLMLTIAVPEDGPPPFEPIPLDPIDGDRFLVTGGVFAGMTADFIRETDGRIRFLRFAGRLASPATSTAALEEGRT